MPSKLFFNVFLLVIKTLNEKYIEKIVKILSLNTFEIQTFSNFVLYVTRAETEWPGHRRTDDPVWNLIRLPRWPEWLRNLVLTHVTSMTVTRVSDDRILTRWLNLHPVTFSCSCGFLSSTRTNLDPMRKFSTSNEDEIIIRVME